ncbi:MAG TPA: aminotransferase class V-fold PLP-dependent enzyme [Bacteroidetes bacterium]|nr:aminotransferase class V-fold PLP-dependent enzyme [Bacteroidota bacterium]
MTEDIERLEHIARQLEPDAGKRSAAQQQVLSYAENFLESIYTVPTYRKPAGAATGLWDSPITEHPSALPELLDLIKEHVDTPGINPASGGHLGYVPGGGVYYAALADYLADVTNRYAGVYFANPGAVEMENLLIEWMASITGYPENAAGNLTSGGSIANLISIVAAREAFQAKAADFHRLVVYTTEQLHHSATKALRIVGLAEAPVRFIPIDERFRMRPDMLEQAIRRDEQAGLKPWLIMASAGTTDTGAVDPLDTIAEIAKTHGLWHHVDGAYGAFFMLTERGREVLRGIEKSDSLVMDPHKGLFLPYGTGAVLVKDRDVLFRAHRYHANYMQDAVAPEGALSPADLSPELTKHFRGLRMWLPLKLHGVAPFRAALEEKLLLTRYFRNRLADMEGFELGPEPDLSITTFRYLPRHGDADDFNRRLLQAIHEDGRVFLSSTQINGTFTLRLAVLCFRTHRQTIDLAIDILAEKIRDLNNR